MKKKETLRGKLIRTVVHETLFNNLFSPSEDAKLIIENSLSKNLNFKTIVSCTKELEKIGIDDHPILCGDIKFEDEFGGDGKVTFKISANLLSTD